MNAIKGGKDAGEQAKVKYKGRIKYVEKQKCRGQKERTK